ncbi:TetR family transcriptional regulator [Murinocardiopsis flavida]|uniref:TetR family transcriptional regulator n=1 Tax=Murinocardiopsis flavida TaxID=645275 RepID=A0A2P8DRP4_9ACTN|nr:TetR/AcrR family transcriptional regulator [Murinocardiopsis flavida]PSK99879.1 TetR family transcriptional regulator [Murinocardiopsis flavida]
MATKERESSSWEVPRLTPGARAALDAAGRLFYERGITAVAVESVAEAAGVTKKTVYDRFKSKSALVCAYLSERDSRYRGWVESWIAEHPETPPVLAVFDALDAWMTARGPKGCAFVHAHAQLLDTPEHPAHRVINGQKQWLHDTFRDLAHDAGVRSADALAAELLCLHEGACVMHSTTDITDAVTRARRAAHVLLQDALATGGRSAPGRK